MTNFEWLDNMLGNKISKEAMESQGTDKQDHFERKVKAHDWINGVTELDPVQVEAEYQAKLKEEAMTLGKTAAYDEHETPKETINKDFERDVKILSDYALAEMLAEARGHEKQNSMEMFYELKEKAKSEVASSREKAEKALLELIPDHTMLDWKKAFEKFTKDSKPAEATEKDLYHSDVPDKAHNFDSPSEEKFKVPADQEKAIPGNGREADERTDATKEAGVLQADITKGLGKEAAKKEHTEDCIEANDDTSVLKGHCICPSDKKAEKVKNNPADDKGNLAMPEGKKSAGDAAVESVEEPTAGDSKKTVGDKDEQSAEANGPEKGDKAKHEESVQKDASEKVAEGTPKCKTCKHTSGTHKEDSCHGDGSPCDCTGYKALDKEAHCGSCPGDPGMEQKGAPEEMEKDAASNDAAIAGFMSGQGGASSANLHVVKGTKGMVLVNYETPIAYRSADGTLYMNSDKYSQTTSSIQSKIRQAAGGKIKEVSAGELETIMEGKPGIVPNAPNAAQPIAEKTADGASASDNCPVCGTAGQDLMNGAKENMSCEACGLTYACGSMSSKADLESDGVYSPEEIAETFVNGNIKDARAAVGGDLDTFMSVLEILGHGSPEGQSFARLMRKAALREIKNISKKADVIKKIAEVPSPWIVKTDENGQEVIARVEPVANEKVSEEDPTTDLTKSAGLIKSAAEAPAAPATDEEDKDKAPTDAAPKAEDAATPAPVAAPAAVVAPAAAPVAAPAAAVVPPAPAASTGDTTSPTRTNTETGGSSPGGASTGGVGSGIGGAGTGGAATGGASTGGAGTVNVTLSGNSGTGSNSDGEKGEPITINISNVGGTTDAGDVASGDGPGSAGEGGSGKGSGGGGGGASPDEPRNFSTSKKDEKKDESDSSMFDKDDDADKAPEDAAPAAAPVAPTAAPLKPLNSAASWIRELLK